MKSYKKFLASFLAVMHVLTFSAPAQQINIQEGTTVNVDSIQVNAGETLTINVLDQLGQVCPSCRGILETNNLLNNGAIDIWGILAIIAPTIINNGTITVQGDLLLSNLGINQEQFFAGIAELSKDPSLANGYILNTGEIKNLTQGLLALVAANGGVHNLGTISSDGGAVVLAAGDRASFPLTRDGVLNIDLGDLTGVKGQVFDKDGNLVETNGLVTNAGVIQANGGAVVLQAAGAEAVYDSIINHTGIIEAKSVAEENGKIILKSETGNITVNNATIDASGYAAGEKGGSIEILTQGNVFVEGNSVLDASGDIGGGSILIGSDVGVTGPITASNVFVGSDVEVKADAVMNGNGGKIIVGAEEVALAYGSFSAKGGAQGGNGGFIETSGKEYLDVDGAQIDASAPNGVAGEWLIDPRNVQVVSTLTNPASNQRGSFGAFGGGAGDWYPNGTGSNAGQLAQPSQVLNTQINTLLNAGTSVTISSYCGNSCAATSNGDISVLAPISKTAGGDATLKFVRDPYSANIQNILIDAAIGSTAGKLNLYFSVNGALTFSANAIINTLGGSLTVVGAPSSITQAAGSQMNVGALDINASGNITLNQAANVFASIDADASFGAGGDINISNSGTPTQIYELRTGGTGGAANSINYTHTGSGDVTLTGGRVITTGGDITMNVNRGLSFDAASIVKTGDTTGGTVNVTGATVLTTPNAVAGSTITLNGGAPDTIIDFTISGPVSQATNYIINATRDIIGQATVTTTGGANVTMTADSDLDGVGGAWIESAGGINSSGDVTITGSAIHKAGAGNGLAIFIENDGSNRQIQAAGNINLLSSTAAVGAGQGGINIQGIVETTGAGKTINIESKGAVVTNNSGPMLIGDNITIKSVGGTNVKVDADNLSYNNSGTGSVAVEDFAGGLTITGATNTSSLGTSIVTHSPLTIAANIIQAGTITLTAGEAAGAGDDLTVNSGVTVQSTAGDVNLNAGDNVALNTTSVVQSNTGAVNVTAGSGDTDNAGNISLAGTVSAATNLVLSALKGTITQTAGSIAATDLTLTSQGNANLNQSTNSVSSLTATTTAGDVTYQDASGLDLKATSIVGNLNLTTGGNLTDSTNQSVTGTTSLTAGANNITLDNDNDFGGIVTVNSANDVTLKDVNNLTVADMTIGGALSLTADSDNNTVGSVLTTGSTSATSVSLSGGTDLDDVINLNGDVTAAAGGVTVQNAATVNLADSVDVTATGGAISFVTNIAQILLNGAALSANKFDTNSDHAIELANVTSTDVHLTVESDGDVTLGDVNLGANGDLTVDVDNDDDGANTGIFGAITANDLSIEGHTAISADENFTFNGAINLTGDYDIGGLGILTYNNDVTAKSITIHDISNRVQLGSNVDLTATNGILSVVTNVVSILLAGANGTVNIFDGNGDAAVNLGPITSTNSNVGLTVNSEAGINLTSANIQSGTLNLAVDNDNDGASTGSFGALTAGTINAGGSGNDNLDFNAAVVANTAGVTISNANNVDFDSTVNTTTTLTQTAGSGTTTFSDTATVGTNASITTGSIAFSGAGNVNANAGTGTVTLNAGTGNITSGTATADVIAGSLTATSATGIDLDTTVTTLTNANVSGTGNIGVRDTAGGLAVTSATTNDGAITINATGGNLDVTLATAGGGEDINLGTITSGDVKVGNVTAAGDNIVINSAGAIEELGSDLGADLTANDLELTAVSGIGAAGTIETDATTLLNANVSGTGAIDLSDLAGGLAVTSATANDGAITINATGGNLDATTVTAGGASRNVLLSTTTSGNVNVGNVTAAGDNIAITSAGAIEELGSDVGADLTSGTMNLTAATGIGAAGTIEIDATTLTNASVSGTGAIDLSDIAGGLAVTSATTNDGAITINATGGNLDVTAATAGGTGRDLNLTTTTSGNIRIGTVNAIGDTATITSAGTIGELVNDDAGVQSSDINAGTINLTTGGGDIGAFLSYLDITPTALWNATSNGGDIYVSCIGVCPMGQIDAGTGTFYYAGNITDGNDAVNGEVAGGVWNIRAGGLHVDADNSVSGFIGSTSNWIEMRLADYDAVAGTNGRMVATAGTGGIHVSNDNPSNNALGLQIGGVTPSTITGLTSTGGIEVYSFSPLVIAANVIDNSASSIDLIAAGNIGSDDLTINTGVTVDQQGSGTVRLFAGDDINLNGTALVLSTTGTISANAGEDFTDATIDQDGTNGGSLVMNSNSAFRSQDGNINLTANNHLRISEVNANSNSDATLGDVNLNADANSNGVGRIEDRNGANALNVTGDEVTMNAGSGIGVDSANTIDAIETAINRLTLTNTTSGHVAVTEVNAGGNLDVVSANQQANAGANSTMTIRTNNGTLTVLDAVSGGSGVQTQSGELLLSANGGGANDDLVVNNTVTSTTAKINLDSNSRDVLFSAAGDVTATGGAEIEVSATNNITMADGTILNANGGGAQGGIDLDAGNDITLGSVQTTSTLSVDVNNDAFNAVDINAGGAVIDGGDTDRDILANSGQTTINAVNGIGHADQLDVELQSLRATNTTANDIRVREMAAGGDLNIVGIDQQALNGDLNIRTQNGSLTVLAAATLLSGFAGGVAAVDGVTRLFAQDNDASGADHLNINNTVKSADGKINLDSENDVIASAQGDVTSGDVARKAGATGAEIEVDALGNITMADGTIFNANAGGPQGAIDMDANANITLGSVQTSSNANNAVVIVSQNGQIIDGGDTDTDIVTGATGAAHLVAETGIGSANGLETQMGQLAARTETGNIQIFNQGDMTVTSLTDNHASGQTGLNGGTTSGVQITDPTNLNTGANFIFVTNNGNLTVNSSVSNLDGGDVSLFSFGNVGLGDMNVNANIESIGANGNMRVVSGGNMNMAAGTNISTEGNGVASGTGVVAVGAGYDVSGKTRNPDMSVNPAFAADVLPGLSAVSLATTSTNGAGSLLDTVKDATANLTMDETARISTESGQIIVDAQNNFTVGRVDADGNAGANGLTDGVVGNILAFARNGSILDDEGPGEVGNLDFVANSLTMLAAGTIGLSNNRIEGAAPFLNTFSIGSQFISILGNTQVEMNSSDGNIFLNATGTILLGHMSAPSGEVHAVAGNNILSQGGGETRVTASNLIELIANGIVGTTSNPIHTHLNATPAQINISAGGQAANGVSAAVFSNISPLAINMLNTPPGLVLFNGTPVAGQSLPGLIGSQASLYYKAFVRGLRQYNDFDGNYAADFPGFVDYQSLISSPDLSVDTTGLDIPMRGITTAPRVVPIPAPAVPTPVPPVTEQQTAVQPQVPELSTQEPTPPAVVPIPARAQPSDQATTSEGVPETPAASN